MNQRHGNTEGSQQILRLFKCPQLPYCPPGCHSSFQTLNSKPGIKTWRLESKGLCWQGEGQDSANWISADMKKLWSESFKVGTYPQRLKCPKVSGSHCSRLRGKKELEEQGRKLEKCKHMSDSLPDSLLDICQLATFLAKRKKKISSELICHFFRLLWCN